MTNKIAEIKVLYEKANPAKDALLDWSDKDLIRPLQSQRVANKAALFSALEEAWPLFERLYEKAKVDAECFNPHWCTDTREMIPCEKCTGCELVEALAAFEREEKEQ